MSSQCNIDCVDARYRLDPLREARTRDERARRVDFAGAVRDAEQLAGELEAVGRRTAGIREAIAAATRVRDDLLAGGARVATLARHDGYLRRLRRDLDAATGEQLRVQARHSGQLEVVDVARQRLTLARAEREVIERHFAA